MNTKLSDNKTLYKIFLIVVKYIPITLFIIQMIGIALNYIGIVLAVIPCVGGVSIIFVALLWLISYVFKFCYLYRLPLWYLTAILILTMIDSFIGIPISTEMMYRLYGFIGGSFILTFIAYAYKNRNKPLDYIKEICDKFNC